MEHKFEWKPNPEFKGYEELFLDGEMVAFLQPRPAYCDRGHYQVNLNLSLPRFGPLEQNIDYADGFPRYYMKKDVAISETEAFLKWRLFKERS
jgi:hypothetical protein